MSNLTMDFLQPSAPLADHFSFFYHFRQSDDRFEGVDRADYAQLRFILRGRNARYRFVDGTEQAMPDIYILGPTTGCSQLSCDGAAEAVGVGLMPHGWAALVPMDASAAANRLFDAKDLFGDIVSEVYRELRASGMLPCFFAARSTSTPFRSPSRWPIAPVSSFDRSGRRGAAFVNVATDRAGRSRRRRLAAAFEASGSDRSEGENEERD